GRAAVSRRLTESAASGRGRAGAGDSGRARRWPGPRDARSDGARCHRRRAAHARRPGAGRHSPHRFEAPSEGQMSTYETTFDASRIPAGDPHTRPRRALPVAAIEQYRALARRLDVGRRAGGPRAMVITSPTTAEGRTTTALYTAVALAGRGHRVVLADF